MSGQPSSSNTMRLPLAAAAFVVMVCMAILALSVWQEWNARTFHLKNAEIDLANLARSLSQHAEDSFDVLDVSILGVVARLEKDGTAPEVIAKLSDILKIRKEESGRIRGFFVYDETGRWLATSERVDITGLNNSDRDYFRYHKQSENRQALIGAPVISRSSGEWVVTLSRRFNHPDGRFAGVVLATIASETFAKFYREFEIGAKGSISLLSADGVLMARSVDNEKFVGRDMSKMPFMSTIASRPMTGAYNFKSPLDGMQRLSFYARSNRMPVIVLATMSEDEVLATWRNDAFARTLTFLLLTAVIAVIGVVLVRQLFVKQYFAMALGAKEADFRLLAEESSDMVTRIGFDEKLLYVSPSVSRILGWTPEQLTGTPALAGVNPLDKALVDDAVAALKRGDIEDARLLYRTRHKHNKEVWLESTMRVTRRPATGEIDGVVAISRDVTKQQEAQQKLESLAMLDGLTGLANRRYFDERFKQEWARARREGAMMAVLMIDVDHFKKFNDEYGHPAGDACLTAVAKVLVAEAKRPADIAARYGGEEFVLLLPNTDAAGCEIVAENIRARIARLGIPHSGNLPSGRLTISLGGAVATPSGDTEAATALKAADLALYAAKNSGRDRLVMAPPPEPEPLRKAL